MPQNPSDISRLVAFTYHYRIDCLLLVFTVNPPLIQRHLVTFQIGHASISSHISAQTLLIQIGVLRNIPEWKMGEGECSGAGGAARRIYAFVLCDFDDRQVSGRALPGGPGEVGRHDVVKFDAVNFG